MAEGWAYAYHGLLHMMPGVHIHVLVACACKGMCVRHGIHGTISFYAPPTHVPNGAQSRLKKVVEKQNWKSDLAGDHLSCIARVRRRRGKS